MNLVVDIDCRLYVNCDPSITPNYKNINKKIKQKIIQIKKDKFLKFKITTTNSSINTT